MVRSLFFLVATAMLLPSSISKVEEPRYEYNISVDMQQHKVWQYIEQGEYKVRLHDGDNIKVNLNVNSNLDIAEIRFYNVCSPELDTGKFYITANGKPTLPTIGITAYPMPVYIAAPSCPEYGTTATFIFDTKDSLPPVEYDFRYEGQEISIKTIELYLVKAI